MAFFVLVGCTLLPAPGRTEPGPNPVSYLPGMRALPAEIISDVSNAPNPVDTRRGGLEGQTRISYRLQGDWPVQITLYDLLGHRVRQWDFSAGQRGGQMGLNHVLWDGTNELGQRVSKGGYIAQIDVTTPTTVATAIRKIGVVH